MKKIACVCALLPALCVAILAQKSPVQEIRSQYLQQNRRAALKLAKIAIQRAPENLEVAAWYAFLGEDDADATFARMNKTAAESPWTLLAGAAADPAAAATLCEKAAAAAPGNSDVLLLATLVLVTEAQGTGKGDDLKAFVDGHQSGYENSADALLAEANARQTIAKAERSTGKDSATVPMELTDRALTLDPVNTAAITMKARLLGRKNPALAYELLADAAVRLPESYGVHSAYWRAAMAARPVDGQKAVAADAQRLISKVEPEASVVSILYRALEGPAPAALKTVADLILEKYPESPAGDMVRLRRAEQDLPMAAPEQNAVAKINALQAFVDRPEHYDDGIVTEANQDLIALLVKLEKPVPEQLYKAVAAIKGDPGGIIRLADAKYRLADLERLAREKLDGQWVVLRNATKKHREANAFVEVHNLLDALGWVYFNEGKLEEAEAMLESALKLYPEDPECVVHRGRVYLARRQFDRAEAEFKSSLEQPYYDEGDHVALQALRDLFVARQGNSEGLDAFMKPIVEKDRERRKKMVIDARIPAPKDMPSFSLPGMDGKTLSSETLQGKILVINFWATWCGPCRKELPDYQRFYEKYRNDPKVAVLTLVTDSSDTPVTAIEAFLQKGKYTFPVLRGSDYAEANRVNTIPMTWFVDVNGKRVFEKLGFSKELMEEFSWRVDATAQGAENPQNR